MASIFVVIFEVKRVNRILCLLNMDHHSSIYQIFLRVSNFMLWATYIISEYEPRSFFTTVWVRNDETFLKVTGIIILGTVPKPYVLLRKLLSIII